MNQVKVKKSMIHSGKHIDSFFDTLIQSILHLHTHIKDQYRQQLDEGHTTFQGAGEAQSPYRFKRSGGTSVGGGGGGPQSTPGGGSHTGVT
jgi:hypothetical protein